MFIFMYYSVTNSELQFFNQTNYQQNQGTQWREFQSSIVSFDTMIRRDLPFDVVIPISRWRGGLQASVKIHCKFFCSSSLCHFNFDPERRACFFPLWCCPNFNAEENVCLSLLVIAISTQWEDYPFSYVPISTLDLLLHSSFSFLFWCRALSFFVSAHHFH